MTKAADITHEMLRERFTYCPESGQLIWKSGRQRGKVAGHRGRNSTRHLCVGIGRSKYLVHRLIWLLVTGAWPEQYVDHINGEKADNRWANLREASASVNQQNQWKPSRNSRSGFRGVSLDKSRGKWIATINKNNTQKYLGSFDSPEAAHAAYVAAKASIHPQSSIALGIAGMNYRGQP